MATQTEFGCGAGATTPKFSARAAMSRERALRAALLLLLVLGMGCSCGPPTGRWVSGGELELVGIHAALMPNGNVLAFGYKDRDHFVDEEGRWQMWDPTTRSPVVPSHVIDDWNPFCAGHCFLGDGRLFVAGGFKFGDPFRSSSADRIGTVKSDPAGSVVWQQRSRKMEDLRWYPTVVTLANGDCLIIGGSAPFAADNWKDTNEDYEYFDVTNDYLVRHDQTHLSYPNDGPFPYPAGDPRQKVADGKRLAGLYPLTHLLPSLPGSDAPNGILFVLNESFLRLYNPTTNRILSPKIDVGGFRTWWTQGSSVLLPIEVDEEGNGPSEVRVLVVGGGSLGKQDANAPALGEAEIWRYNVATRTIARESAIPLQRNRVMGDSVLLPDGNVVVVGGAEIGYTNENSRRIRHAELIRLPQPGLSGSTVDLPEASVLRGYHATALLLPDGAVFVTGGNGNWNNAPVQEFTSVEVFEPPYLFLGSRPILSEAPAELARGQTFSAVANQPVDPYLVLVRHGSRTHSLDTDQRMLRLRARVEMLDGDRRRLTATFPGNPTLAPPGPYRLHVLARIDENVESPQRLIPSLGSAVLVRDEEVRPDLLVQRIRITIRTGGDDLRGGDDNALATVFDSAGTVVVPEFGLNNGSRWENETVHAVTRVLSPPVSLRRLRQLRIRTTFGGGIGGDNWDIDRVIVDYDSGSGWRTLHDASGDPLVRLTGDRKVWRTSL